MKDAFQKAFVDEPKLDVAQQGSGVDCPLVAVVALLLIVAALVVLL